MVFLLERMAEEGHVFAPFGYLEHQFGAGLEMDPQLAAQAVEELVETGELWPRILAATAIARSICAACTTPRPRWRSGCAG